VLFPRNKRNHKKGGMVMVTLNFGHLGCVSTVETGIETRLSESVAGMTGSPWQSDSYSSARAADRNPRDG